jgi:hypothetical protein
MWLNKNISQANSKARNKRKCLMIPHFWEGRLKTLTRLRLKLIQKSLLCRNAVWNKHNILEASRLNVTNKWQQQSLRKQRQEGAKSVSRYQLRTDAPQLQLSCRGTWVEKRGTLYCRTSCEERGAEMSTYFLFAWTERKAEMFQSVGCACGALSRGTSAGKWTAETKIQLANVIQEKRSDILMLQEKPQGCSAKTDAKRGHHHMKSDLLLQYAVLQREQFVPLAYSRSGGGGTRRKG